MIEETNNLIYGTAELADLVLRNPDVQALLRSKAKFDLLLLHAHMTDSLLGYEISEIIKLKLTLNIINFFSIANYYQIPSIIISTGGSAKFIDAIVGNPFNPSYVPHAYLGYTTHMNFRDRLINTLVALFDEITYR